MGLTLKGGTFLSGPQEGLGRRWLRAPATLCPEILRRGVGRLRGQRGLDGDHSILSTSGSGEHEPAYARLWGQWREKPQSVATVLEVTVVLSTQVGCGHSCGVLQRQLGEGHPKGHLG
jgi:hypothetical protein